MALFPVAGWSMPSDARPVAAASKKRKRPGGPDADKLQAAEVNLEKLMRQLDSAPKQKQKQDKLTHTHKPERKPGLDRKSGGGKPNSPHKDPAGKGKRRDAEKRRAEADTGRRDHEARSPSRPSTGKLEGVKKSVETKKKSNDDRPRKQQRADHDNVAAEAAKPSPKQISTKDKKLTSLQAHMKATLDGARFRWINETLYKSGSKAAHEMMQADQSVFEEYHAGFRRQVTSWPSNPVVHFISTLSSRPKGTVVVDLGCGDAQMARELLPRGFIVLSYDLISTDPYVVEADICSKLPLPGDEVSEDASHIVDVVVCSLSLMSTNWLNCIREARRVLKSSGELKIAEVSSRFTNVDKFVSTICSVGFKLDKKDDKNTHFTLFDFTKIPREELSDQEWESIKSNNEVLQPCEYKRR